MIELYGKTGALLGQYDRGEKVPLVLSCTSWIEPVSKALLRHDAVRFQLIPDLQSSLLVMMVRAPGAFNIGLLVDQGPVDSGELFTPCFNLLDQRLRIAKGEVMSWLIEL